MKSMAFWMAICVALVRSLSIPIAMKGVSVSGFEQGAGGVDGNEERGARDQLLVIHVAGVNPGRVRAHAPRIARRRHAHAAKEGMERDHDVRRELRGHARAIERDDPRAMGAIAIGRQKSTAAVVAVRKEEIDAEDPHLEHVSRIGSLDKDGPRENVSAGALVG